MYNPDDQRETEDAVVDQRPAEDVPAPPGETPAPVSPPASVQFTPAQQALMKGLAESLTREQALWVSGYFAGISGLATGAFAKLEAATEATSASATISVLHASETGNSTGLAQRCAAELRGAGFNVQLSDMGEYKVRQLKEERFLLIITSTHGEGDPPQSALGFFDFIEGRKAPKLPGAKFAVLALGDSTYEKYCEAGKRLDRRFEELGAIRLAPRVDCDVDFDSAAAQWMDTVRGLLAKEQPKAPQGARLSVVPETAAAPVFGKRNPFAAPVIENLVLTGRGSSKETRHIELSLGGSDITYMPGDALGIAPMNDAAIVEAILSETHLEGGASVTGKDGEKDLAGALTAGYEIQTATPRFLENWARLSGAAALQHLTLPENTAERSAFLHRHHVVDILRQFPVRGVKAADLIAGLRPLQPRLYSIASSLAAAPDEVHLTVATVRYELHGERRTGVASGHIAIRAEPDTTLPVYVQSNPHFRLPEDDVAIIMIGAGTGMAPYRAFLQEREARGSTGRSWLFFGDRNFRTDFLYQAEWQEYLRSGVLTRMNVAFSRDRSEKVYVQHRLRDNAADLYAWLEEGAHLYICGDAANMAPDVHAALLAVVQEQGRLTSDAAEEYLRNLQLNHRYQRDVY